MRLEMVAQEADKLRRDRDDPDGTMGEVADRGGDAESDVIAAGRELPARFPWSARLAWLLVVAETVALAGAVAVALHYRAEVGRIHHGGQSATGQPALPGLLQMTSVAVRMPADGTIAGMVLISVTAPPGGDRAQFTVSAFITGGKHHWGQASHGV